MKFSNPIPRAWQWTSTFVVGHKVVSGLIAVALLGGAYGVYTLVAATSAGSQYVVQDAATGTIVATVSGTGQVSASNEVIVSSKASGNITSVKVVAGQAVRAGQLIATTDPGTSEFELESAKLSLERAQTSTKTGLTDKQTAYDTANANLTSAKESGVNQVTTAYGTMDQQLVSLSSLYSSNGYLAPNAGDNTQRSYVNTAQSA
jgi:multidrug efflux pump subunit AcrA (membrane-fusion protein)